MSLHNNRPLVSPLAVQSETRTAGPDRIQGLSSSQNYTRCCHLLMSVAKIITIKDSSTQKH